MVTPGEICLLKRIIRLDDMARDSLIMVIAGLGAGFLNSVFQISMGMLLAPQEYGALFSLLAVSVIVTTVANTFQTSTTRFVSKFRASGDAEAIGHVWGFSLKRTLLLGLLAFTVGAVLSPVVSSFLKIESLWYVVIVSASFFLTFSLPVARGVLGGLQRFLPLGLSTGLWAAAKVVIGVSLVSLGLGVSGGLLAIPFAYLLTFLVTFLFLRDIKIVGRHEKGMALHGFFSYTGLAFVATVLCSVLLNLDMILAKHYLAPEDAGSYAAMSALGKIAFYASTGVAVAMFPKTSELFDAGGLYRSVLRRGVIYTLALGGVVVVAYWLFSDYIVGAVFGHQYEAASAHLFRYGLAMLLFALAYLLMMYLLSVNRRGVVLALGGGLILQVVLMLSFHSSIGNFADIMLVCGASCVVLMIPLCR